MSEFNKLRNRYRKMKSLNDEINKEPLKDFIGEKVKVTKKCADWYKEHGEECGIPYDEMTFILKKPLGIIKSIEYCGFTNGFNIRVEFKELGFSELLGIEDINLVKIK